jgi:hypothetical protein
MEIVKEITEPELSLDTGVSGLRRGPLTLVKIFSAESGEI